MLFPNAFLAAEDQMKFDICMEVEVCAKFQRKFKVGLLVSSTPILYTYAFISLNSHHASRHLLHSVTTGAIWKHLLLSEQAKWEQATEETKAKHRIKHPDYGFRPVHDKANRAAKVAKAEIERKAIIVKVVTNGGECKFDSSFCIWFELWICGLSLGYADSIGGDNYIPVDKHTKKYTSRTISTSTPS
jgi:hypothetical protein